MPLSVFQGKFCFRGLFKTVLYIQVLFKPVRTLAYACTYDKYQNIMCWTLKINFISHPKKYVVATQMNHIKEMVLLSTQNIYIKTD